MCFDSMISYQHLYDAYTASAAIREQQSNKKKTGLNPLKRFLSDNGLGVKSNGFTRMEACRQALDALDNQVYSQCCVCYLHRH